MDQLCIIVNLELDVVNKPKKGTAKFDVQVIVRFADDRRPRKTANDALQYCDNFSSITGKRERFDAMFRIAGPGGNAIGRIGAGR